MASRLALDEALSQLAAPKATPPTPSASSKVSSHASTSPKKPTPKATAAFPTFNHAARGLEDLALAKDNLIPDDKRVTVHMLSTRFGALCSRVLPFGNIGELELQVLAMTSTGYAQEGGTDLWLQKSRLAREYGRRWYQRLRQAHSEPHRALHTLAKVALILSYLDTFSSPVLEESSQEGGSEGKKSPREEARTAAEVIGSAHVSRKDALELAVWFQDSVCAPGDGDVVSKRESASVFESFARDGGLPDSDRCKISRTIRHTAIFSSVNTSTTAGSKSSSSPNSRIKSKSKSKKTISSSEIDTAMLRSFNRIFLFGALKSVHCERSHQLRLEYRHLPNGKYCKRRAGMLREYLSLKRFLEPDGGSLWMQSGHLRDQVEREIRRNLKFEIEALRRCELPGELNIMNSAGGAVLPLLELPRYMDGDSGQVYVTPLVDGAGVGRRGGGEGGGGGGGGRGRRPVNDSISSSLAHCVIVPGGRTLRQCRSEPVVYYVLRGVGEVFRNGRADDVKTNDTVRVQANIPYHFVNRHREQELYMLIIGSSSSTVLE